MNIYFGSWTSDQVYFCSYLQSELKSGEREVKALEKELRRAEDTLTEMKTATQELFDLLQCDPQPIVAIVGECAKRLKVCSSYCPIVMLDLGSSFQKACSAVPFSNTYFKPPLTDDAMAHG